MKVSEFIKVCARGLSDYNFRVFSVAEWFNILSFQIGELFPEIAITDSTTGDLSSIEDNYQLDLSSISNIHDIKRVTLTDSDGNDAPYSNWVYNSDTKVLDLDPTTSKAPDKSISAYSTYEVVYFLESPTLSNTESDIDLSAARLNVLKDICVRAALEQILNDHIKLDRYRTYVGKMNEYALMAWFDRLSTQIELYKRKLANTHPVRAY